MTNKYAGTQTEKNLEAAFAGESQARNKYTYFASVAKKEGYEQISSLFLKTADNEKEHAKMWFKELSGIGDTKQNLKARQIISPLRLTARILSGPTCMRILQRQRRQKDFLSLRQNSERLARLRNIMRSVIARF